MRNLLASVLVALIASDTIAAELYVFVRPGCQPCEEFKRAAERDPTLLGGFDVFLVDGFSRPDIAKRFGVRSYPTFVLVEEERELRRTSGFSDSDNLRQFLDRQPNRRRSK